jgi:hypothetical protein
MELASAIFPAYLLDCGHRLLAWNRFIPKLFHSDQPPFPQYLTSILRALFDPHYLLSALIANPDEFFPAQMRALRYEMRLFRGESWYSPLIEDVKAECPKFEKYWTQSLHENAYIAARPLVPINLNISAIGSLCFRLTSEPFAQDRRFRIIYYIPADSVTIQHCLTGF